MKITIAGYRRNETDGKVTYAEVRGQAVITRIVSGPRAKSAIAALVSPVPVAAFAVEGIKEPVDCGVVLTEAGAPLGFITPTLPIHVVNGVAYQGPPLPSNGFRYDTAAGQPPAPVRTIAVQPLTRLDRLRDPECVDAVLAAVKGDVKHVTYDLAATVNDPFNVIESLRFEVLFADAISLQHAQGWVPGTWPVSCRAVEVPVARGKPSKKVAAQLADQQHVLAEPTWTGRFEDENPGADFSVTYRLQPVVKVGGSEQRLAACTAQYVVGPRQFGPPQDFKRPDIPGFDGVPLDMPRPEKLAGGEYRITGAATRVEEQPPPVTLTFPQPQKQSKPLAVAKRTEQGWQITELPVVTEVSDKVTSRQSLHMIFSPDGKWLFVVDAENVLHKIGTEDLVEQATLKVGGACGDLCVSQAGLLAAARDAGQLWIIDPDSLAVRRAIALPGAMRVACSPRGNLALAVYRVPLLPPESQLVRLRTELGLIDLESGRILHRIRQFYGDRPLTLAGHPLFGSLQEWSYVRNQAYNLDPPTPSIAATGDGKHFFVGTGQIWRFRVDGNDLIYEEGAFENRSPLGVVTCVLSADDRFALLRGELVRGGIVVDPLRLSDVKCEMKDVRAVLLRGAGHRRQARLLLLWLQQLDGWLQP